MVEATIDAHICKTGFSIDDNYDDDANVSIKTSHNDPCDKKVCGI
jgi:hypothetical protein